MSRNVYYIGITIGKKYWRKGYGKIALKPFLNIYLKIEKLIR